MGDFLFFAVSPAEASAPGIQLYYPLASKHTLVSRESSQPTRYDEPKPEGRTRRPPAVGTILAVGSSMAMARAFSVPSLALHLGRVGLGLGSASGVLV